MDQDIRKILWAAADKLRSNMAAAEKATPVPVACILGGKDSS